MLFRSFPFYNPVYKSNYRYPSSREIKQYINSGVNAVKSSLKMNALFLGTPVLSAVNQINEAVSPEYEHQRNRERRNKEELDQNQANIARSIDTNISGNMPNGDPAPKRNPQDGGRKTIIGVTVVSSGALSRIILDETNPDPSEDSYEVHTKKNEKKREYGRTIWDILLEWLELNNN